MFLGYTFLFFIISNTWYFSFCGDFRKGGAVFMLNAHADANENTTFNQS